MLKLWLLSGLLIFSRPVLSQFNTVLKTRTNPSVRIDQPTETFEQGAGRHSSATHDTASLLQVSMPLSSPAINSPYGRRRDPITGELTQHRGIDFRARQDSVLSIMPGRVKRVGYSKGLGSYIEVEHGAWRSIYGHLSVILVQESMVVSAGEVIAISGNTGRSTGEHLHFAIRHRGRIVDPTPYLDLIYRKIEMSNKKRSYVLFP